MYPKKKMAEPAIQSGTWRQSLRSPPGNEWGAKQEFDKVSNLKR